MTTDLSFLSTKKAVVNHETVKLYKDGDIYTKYESYFITQKQGMSTREISLFRSSGEKKWSGDMIAFGEWWGLDQEDIDYVLRFLEEWGGEHF